MCNERYFAAAVVVFCFGVASFTRVESTDRGLVQRILSSDELARVYGGDVEGAGVVQGNPDAISCNRTDSGCACTQSNDNSIPPDCTSGTGTHYLGVTLSKTTPAQSNAMRNDCINVPCSYTVQCYQGSSTFDSWCYDPGGCVGGYNSINCRTCGLGQIIFTNMQSDCEAQDP
jgi:hypothetical protein